MKATPINWQLAQHKYNQAVIDEINHVVQWFGIECQSSTIIDHNNLKLAVQREMEKLKLENSSRKLVFAILALYNQSHLHNPLNINFTDIENARWVIKNSKYGFPKSSPTTNLEKASTSFFTF